MLSTLPRFCSPPQVSAFQRTRFALGMRPEDIEQLQSALKIAHYEADEALFVEGSPASHFYILIEGEVELNRLNKEGVEEFVMLRRAGDSVGDSALSHDPNAKYSVTALAAEPTSVLVASRADFASFFARNRPELRKEWESMLGESVFQWLRRVDFMKDIQDWLLLVLANLFTYVVAVPGQRVIKQDVADSRSMFIVVKGKLREHHRESDELSVALGDIRPGQYFGEMAMIIDIPRMSTVEAVEPTLLLELPVSSFQDFLNLAPQVQSVFAVLAKHRITHQIEKSAVPFFRSIPQVRIARCITDVELYPQCICMFLG